MTRLKTALILSLLALLAIKFFTIEHASISGNGNPGILAIFIFVPFALWLSVEWVLQGIAILNSRTRKLVALLVSIFVLIGGTQRTLTAFANFKPNFIAQYVEKYGPVDSEHIDMVLDGLNIFTNTLYFNFTTFTMYLALLTLIALTIKPFVKNHQTTSP